jgi:hypothetical protein
MGASAVVVDVPSGTADDNVFVGTCSITGWSFEEDAGTAAVASLVIRDSAATSTSAQALAYVQIGADQSVNMSYEHPIRVNAGIFVDRVAGSNRGVIYIL